MHRSGAANVAEVRRAYRMTISRHTLTVTPVERATPPPSSPIPLFPLFGEGGER